MSILESTLPRNDAFEARSAHWTAVAERLAAEAAEIALGGGTKALERHLEAIIMRAAERDWGAENLF